MTSHTEEPGNRPGALSAAAALHATIGSLAFVLGVVMVFGLMAIAGSTDLLVGIGIAFALPVYGALATTAGVLLWRRMAIGWWLALVLDLVVLGASLSWLPTALAPDRSVLVMVALVMLALTALLVVPATRHAARP